MSDLPQLAERMKGDWNRRIRHDYRFWMSDGYASDEAMWASGERDLSLVLQDLEMPSDATFLELGCGVGRLLRAARARFTKVRGVDVSSAALDHARRLLHDQEGIELIEGNGYDLSQIADGSIDVFVSFAALTSTPTDVIASYLRECARVLSPRGVARLQLYLGKTHRVTRGDTLHLRCFARERLLEAAKLAALDVEWIRELVLPFQISIKEAGIEACIVSLRRAARPVADVAQISRALLPEGEPVDTELVDADSLYSPELEQWMAVNYARELIERGEVQRARETLEYAASVCESASIDVRDLLQRLQEKLTGVSKLSPAPTVRIDDAPMWQANLAVLDARRATTEMPFGWQQGDGSSEVEVRATAEGPVLWCHGQCLDHPEKPVAAARAWARRAMQEPRVQRSERVIVYGFGSGYHLEALLEAGAKRVSVVEPSIAVFRAALQQRDLRDVLQRLDLIVVGDSSLPNDLETAELLVRPQTQAVAPKGWQQLQRACYGVRGFAELKPSIAVVGPFMGGTLPIATYASRALYMLEQRMRSWDVSGFTPGLQELERFVRDKGRQSTLQGNYIEMVSQVLLEAASEKPVDIVLCMAQAPLSGRALQELRNRGVITALWFTEDYLRFGYWREMARYYDFIFTIQKGACIDAIKQAGAGSVHYVPMACDAGLHRPMELSLEERERWGSPISFVGAGYHNRQQVFAGLADLPFKIWGTEWPGCRPFDRLVQEEGRRLTPDEYIKIFNATDINLNLHSSAERDGVDPTGDFVNPRTFELAACGAFQLVDERSLLPELFTPGEEVVTFASPAELKEKIAYYQNRPEERRAIAARARARALRDHTYDQRLRQMLQIIYAEKFDAVKERLGQSPWHRMLERAAPYPELQQRCRAAFERGEEPNLDGLISDIVTGKGKLSETEQKLLFLFHIRKQIIRMHSEERGGK